MNGTAATSEIQNDKLDAAHEWLHQNGNNVTGIEQKLEPGNAGEKEYAAPIMTVRRKVKRKEDGPLEIICGWIVEHQIGRLFCPNFQEENQR